MNILIIGLGVIGTTYGYLFQKAGHTVEHYFRPGSPKAGIRQLKVELLDGRIDSKGTAKTDVYQVNPCSQKKYDFIFVSVPSGGIAGVVQSLDAEGISGTILLCCGIWEDRVYVDGILQGRDYILGYPVAGGNIADGTLNCCVFDHFMLEREERSRIPDYAQLLSLFASCDVKTEQPYDMLEWIWLHMAINAAVVSVAGKYGSIDNTAESAEALMNSSAKLAEAVRAIRETSGIVAARGVDLRHYRNELWAYKLPTFLSAPMMKRMFKNNILTRKIMTLHGNVNDLLFVCKSLYETGQSSGIKAPVFYTAYQSLPSRT